MALATNVRTIGFSLNEIEERRLLHQLENLERRLVHHPEPSAALVLTQHRGRRQVEVDLRIELGPLGSRLISHQQAETADQAVRQAVEDVERQLERRLAGQRGEPSFGIPSRRQPTALRPSRRTSSPTDEEAADGTEAAERVEEPG